MDWTLIIAGVAAVAAVASAVVAIVQARQAAVSKADANTSRTESQTARDESAALAAKATDAFVRSATAQEEANKMRRAELAPPDWTGPEWVAGQTYKVVNSSGRTILIDSFDVQPDQAAGLVHVDGHPDAVYRRGESFNYLSSRAGMGGARSPETLTVHYRFEDDFNAPQRTVVISL